MNNLGKIYTGSFASISTIKRICLVPIAISTGIPSFYKGGLRYKKLQPSIELTHLLRSCQKNNSIDTSLIQNYAHDYIRDVLGLLNPDEVYAELKEMANGKDFCILSQEHSDEFSHRMIVSTWFRRFGYEVEEIVKYNK